jgi:hypothetical protein
MRWHHLLRGRCPKRRGNKEGKKSRIGRVARRKEVEMIAVFGLNLYSE